MDSFDNMIRSRAKREPFIEPIGFGERINNITSNLPEISLQRRRKRTARIIFVAAAIMILTAAAAFAAPSIDKTASGTISYFNAPRDFKYLSKQAIYEKYNSNVGITVEDKGITLTIDNIAMDDNYINVFYTIKNEKPIQLLGDEADLEQWRLNGTAPYFWFKENNRYIQPQAQGEVEAYLADDYTLKGMQRLALMGTLDDTVNLEIYTKEIFSTKGQWHISISVDKSSAAVESLTVIPKVKARVTTGWNKEYTHDIKVEKVSISPFGCQLVLSEKGNKPFNQFALRDENDKYLTVIPTATSGGNLFMKPINSFEFIGGSLAMKELTIIPIVTGADSDGLTPPRLVVVDNNSFPIEMPVSKIGGFILDSFKITDKKAVATFRQKGAVQIMTPDLILMDKNDEQVNLSAFQDTNYNRKTGVITLTYTFNDASKEDIAKVKKLGYFTRQQRLNEDEAITIKLK